jgi:hypothetical protein
MTIEVAGQSPVQLNVPSSRRLRRELSAFGVLLLTLSCLSPVLSIYGVGSDVLKHAGTGSAMLFVVGKPQLWEVRLRTQKLG